MKLTLLMIISREEFDLLVKKMIVKCHQPWP
jgi:hypothetical protein